MKPPRAASGGAIRPSDLVTLAARPGPFASVWLGLSGTGHYGQGADERRRKNVEADLANAGAPHSICAAVGGTLSELEPGTRGAVVIADASGVRLVERLPGAPRHDLARWAPLPSLAPVVEHRQADIPAVVVLADRVGADILVRGPGGTSEHVEVEGDDDPITKTGQGGWSQRRYDQRVEDTWEHNASAVAEQVTKAIERSRAQVAIVGGDLRAVELIVGDLPESVRSVVRTIAHGRATDGAADRRAEEVERWVRTAVAEQTVALLQEFEQRSSKHPAASNGPRDTLKALGELRVDVLLAHDDPADERRAWIGANSHTAVASTADEVRATGADATEARLVDAAICAAFGSGASVRIVPEANSLHGGLGALLRWD